MLIYVKTSTFIDDFRAKTNEMFHSWDGYTPDKIEDYARYIIEYKLREVYFLSYIEVHVVGVVLTGSRCRGLERKRSDIDIAVFYTGITREDDLFNMLNRTPVYFGGHRMDINPIHIEDENGVEIEDYLREAEAYLSAKREKTK